MQRITRIKLTRTEKLHATSHRVILVRKKHTIQPQKYYHNKYTGLLKCTAIHDLSDAIGLPIDDLPDHIISILRLHKLMNYCTIHHASKCDCYELIYMSIIDCHRIRNVRKYHKKSCNV